MIVQVPWRFLHQPFFRLVEGNRCQRQHLANEVNGKNLNRCNGCGQAHRHTDKTQQDTGQLCVIRGNRGEDGFLEVGEYRPSLCNRCRQGAEVIVEQYDLRCFFRHLRSGTAHGHTDICLFQTQGVVDTVAGYGNHIAHLLQQGDNPILVLGRHPGKDNAAALKQILQFSIRQGLHGPVIVNRELAAVITHTDLARDCPGRDLAVARDHHHPHAAVIDAADGFDHPLSGRVEHGDETCEHKVLLRIFRPGLLAAVKVTVGKRYHPQRLIAHMFAFFQDIPAQAFIKLYHVTVKFHAAADVKHAFQRPFHVRNRLAVMTANNGHPFPG